MSTDRASILDQIHQSLKSARLPAARAALPPRPAVSSARNRAVLVESFTRELTALKGTVHAPRPPAQAIETVFALLRESGGAGVLAWADDALAVAGLGAGLRQAGIKLIDPNVPNDREGRRAKQVQLACASFGITGALAGLADTGSLVVTSGPTRSRLASLLPPTHIALLRVADLYPSLPDFFAAQPGVVRAGSNVVIITGPSRTADIELTPVLGVHGPKVVHVVLIA
ncbi:MAG TPA: lactate utilization protein [Anaerolineae bacterium]|nr:lactate utilization protein [Anaerolineae bacterium]